jgi:hypothetical protein
MANANEIARKLNLNVEDVNKSNALINAFNEINNNPNLSKEDKNDAFDEISNFFRAMIQNK